MAIIRKGHFDRIAIHHSAVSPGAKNLTEAKSRAASYDRSHKTHAGAEEMKTPGEFGYKYIRYHYIIARDGSILQTQNEKYCLYHASDWDRGPDSFNQHGIGVLLDGNFMTEKPSEQQRKALVNFIVNFKKKHPGNFYCVGHKETDLSTYKTACPGINVGTSKSGWLKGVMQSVQEILHPKPPVEPPIVTPPVEPPVVIPPEPEPEHPPITPIYSVVRNTIELYIGTDQAEAKRIYDEEVTPGVITMYVNDVVSFRKINPQPPAPVQPPHFNLIEFLINWIKSLFNKEK